MKSERRHELQQNDLAIYLDRINKSIEPYSRIIAVVIGVVAVAAIAFAFYRTEQSGQRSVATYELIQATASQDAEVLQTVSDSYPETAAGAWARLYRGKQYLSQGIQSLYQNRDDAEELLVDAQAAFSEAIATSDDPLLRSRAQYGIARAAESLGNLEEATEAYKEVIAINESEAMIKKAEERIETLADPKSKEFLAWFGDQDFAPADPSLPPSLPGGASLPDLPDLDLPDLSLSSDGDMELRDLEGGLELPEMGAGEESGEDQASDKDADKDADEPAAADDEGEESAEEKSSEEQPAAEETEPESKKPDPAEPESDQPDASSNEASSSDDASQPESGESAGDGESDQ